MFLHPTLSQLEQATAPPIPLRRQRDRSRDRSAGRASPDAAAPMGRPSAERPASTLVDSTSDGDVWAGATSAGADPDLTQTCVRAGVFPAAFADSEGSDDGDCDNHAAVRRPSLRTPAAQLRAATPPLRAPATRAEPTATIFADAALSKLKLAVVPPAEHLAAVESQPAGAYGLLDAVAHIDKLDRINDSLSYLSGKRPLVWLYPAETPDTPIYPAKPTVARPMSPAALASLRRRAASGSALVPTAHTLWRALLQGDAVLAERGVAPSLGVLANAVSNLADETNRAEGRRNTQRQTDDAIRGKTTASLLFRLAVARGRWSLVLPALQHYAKFAREQPQVRYQSYPLLGADLCQWIDNCPAHQLPYVDLWQQGLHQVVDASVFARLLARTGEQAMPLRRIDRYLAAAAEQGRRVSTSTINTYVARLPAQQAAPGEFFLAGLVRQTLMQSPRPRDHWPQLPYTLGAEDAAERRAWTQRLFAGERQSLRQVSPARLLIALADLLPDAQPALLQHLCATYPEQLTDPFVAVPMAQAQLVLHDVAAATQTLARAKLGAFAEHAQALNWAMDEAAAIEDWQAYATLHQVAQRSAELRSNTAARPNLAAELTEVARSTTPRPQGRR